MDPDLRFYNALGASGYGERWTIEEESRIAAGRLAEGEARLLEVGCGSGRALANLPAGVVGVDYAAEMLDAAHALLPGARLVRARGEALPFAEGTFPTAVVVNALHNQEDIRVWLCELRRLRPRRLILDYRNYWNPVMQLNGWRFRRVMQRQRVSYRPRRRGEMIRILAACGWHVTRTVPVRRPVVDAGTGFRWRHALGHLISRLPCLAPCYLLEAVPMRESGIVTACEGTRGMIG